MNWNCCSCQYSVWGFSTSTTATWVILVNVKRAERREGRKGKEEGRVPLRGLEVHFRERRPLETQTEWERHAEDFSCLQLQMNSMTNFESRISRCGGFRKGLRESNTSGWIRKKNYIREKKRERAGKKGGIEKDIRVFWSGASCRFFKACQAIFIF